MELRFKQLIMPLGLTTLLASSMAFAVSPGNNEATKKTFTKDVAHNDNTNYRSDTDVDITKFNLVSKIVRINGGANITADSAAMATVNNKQINVNNRDVNDKDVLNDADQDVVDNVGNVGANNAAGDFNQQANEVDIAVTDAANVFADAEAFGYQDIEFNDTFNDPQTRNTAIQDVERNIGNVGANNAAGTGNQQKNVLVAAVADRSILAESTSDLKQTIDHNRVFDQNTTNRAFQDVIGNIGNVGANNAAGVNNQQYNALQIAVTRSGANVSNFVQ